MNEMLAVQEREVSDDEMNVEIERLRLWLGDAPLSIRLSVLARRGDPATQLVEYARTRAACWNRKERS